MAHVENYRLSDGRRRYRARWLASGKPKSKSFLLKKDAERFVHELQRRATLGPFYQVAPETLEVFLAGWLERYSQRVRASTAARVCEVLPHLRVFGALTLDAIRPADVEDHVAALARRARPSSRSVFSSRYWRTRRNAGTRWTKRSSA